MAVCSNELGSDILGMCKSTAVRPMNRYVSMRLAILCAVAGQLLFKCGLEVNGGR